MESSAYSYQSQTSSLYNYYFPQTTTRQRSKVPALESSEDSYQTVELRQGKVVYKQDFSVNDMRTRNYSKLNFLVKILFHIFSLNGNLFFLVVSLIQLSDSDLSPFLRWIYIAPLGFYALFRVCKEVFFNYQKVKFDNKVNKTKVRKLTFSNEGDGTQETTWENLEVGDIVYLKKGEYVPADLVLLDASESFNRQNGCYITTKLIDGRKNLVPKIALKTTKLLTEVNSEPNLHDYKHLLSGTMEFTNPSGNFEDFKGILKLNKDPRAEILGKENFIMKMSKLKNTKWIVGIVVYCGKNAKILYNADFLRQKPNFAARVTKKFNYFMIFIVLLLSMISVVALIGNTIVRSFIRTYEWNTGGTMFFFYLIQYANFVPLSIYFTLDIIELVHFWMSRYHRDTGRRKHFITPFNPSAFADLGTIDYVVTDTTALTYTNSLRVHQVYIADTLYTIEQDEVAEKIRKKPLPVLESSGSEMNNTKDIKFKQAKKNLANGGMILEESRNKESEKIEEEKKEEDDGDDDDDEPSPISLRDAVAAGRADYQSESESHLENLITGAPSLGQLPETSPHNNNQMAESQRKLSNEQQLGIEEEDNEDEDDTEEKTTDGFVRDFFRGKKIEDLLRSVLICSEATVIRDKESVKIITNSQEEKILLRFAKSCRFYLEETPFKGGKSIKTGHTSSQYSVIGESAPFMESGKYSAVVAGHQPTVSERGVAFDANPNLDESFLYVKGTYSKLRHLLKMPRKAAVALDRNSERMYQDGKIPIIFARRRLRRFEVEKFRENYKNFKTNLNSQPQALDKIFEVLETELEFVGICTLIQKKIAIVDQTLDTLNKAAINTWVVSNESFEKILLLLREYKLLSSSKSHFYIDGESQESVAISVKLHMSHFRKIYENEKHVSMRQKPEAQLNKLSEKVMERMSDHVVIISGKAFEFIRQDRVTYDNFAFLCAVSARVIGFSFSSEDKQALIRMAKVKFSEKTQVMAVGTTYSDVAMLNAADVGVFCTNFKENVYLPWADFKTSDISNLKKLLLEKGVAFTHQIDHSIYYLFYKSVALSMPLFYYNWFSSMTGTSIYDSVLLFLFNFLFTLLPILSLSFDEPFSKNYIDFFPALYAESRYKKLHLLKKFILRVWVEGMVHSVLVFYLCLYHISSSADSNADPGDLKMLSLVIVMSLVFIVDFKMFFHFTQNKLPLWGTITLSLTMLFGFFWINTKAELTEGRASNIDLERFIHRPNAIFVFFFVIFAALAFSYIMNNYVVATEVANAWQLLADKFRKGKFKELDNNEILNVLKYKENQLTRIIKNVYKNADRLENFVLEMLNMLGKDLSQLNLRNLTLAFRDRVMEQRFQFTKMTSSIWFVKLCYYVGTIIFIILSIVMVIVDTTQFALARFLASVLFIGFCVFVNTRWYQKYYLQTNVMLIFLVIALKLSFDYIRNDNAAPFIQKDDGSISTALFILILCTFFLFDIKYTIVLTVMLIAPYYVRQGLAYNRNLTNTESTFYVLFSNYILLTSLAAVSFYTGVQLEKQSRNEFIASISIDNQNSTYSNILSILVPDFVKTLLSRGVRYLAEDQGKVAILFCDICEFDDLIREKGKDVVQILDSLWRQFDKYCIDQGVQKIETVGKTYMACAGLKSTEREFSAKTMTQNATKRVVNMAIEMMNYVEETTLGDGQTLKMKIGVHYGRVIAGIIGEHKPQFSLIGSTVNFTSRVCSTGQLGKITLSEDAFHEVRSRGLKFSKEQVFAKGIGKIWTYIIEREKKARNPQMRMEQGRNASLRNIQSMFRHNLSQMSNSPTLKDDHDGREENHVDRAKAKKRSLHMLVQEVFQTTNPMPPNIIALAKEEEKDNVEARTQLLKPSKLLLRLPDTPLSRQYEIQNSTRYRKFFSLSMLFLATIIFAQTLITLIVRQSLEIEPEFIAIRAVFSGYIAIMVLFGKYFDKREWIERILLFIVLLYGSFVVTYQSYQHQDRDPATPDDWFHKVCFLEFTIILVIGLTSKKLEFVHCVIFYIIITILWIIYWAINPSIDYIYLFYYFTLMLFVLGKQYIGQNKDIKAFNLVLKQNQRYYEQNTLISQLLPLHALDKLRGAEQDLTDEMDDVTLLFSDIAGFTKFSNAREPEEVVTMLTELFTEFDKMCVKLGVYKVYTIGDAYIVMGFTNMKFRNPTREANNILKMGMAMIDIIRKVRAKLGYDELEMRIGIHTGKVIGGIIGTDIVRYDLYGKDYLIGNKMESTGKEGMIKVSETTKQLLEKEYWRKYRFERHTDVEVPKLQIPPVPGYLVYYNDDNANGYSSSSLLQKDSVRSFVIDTGAQNGHL